MNAQQHRVLIWKRIAAVEGYQVRPARSRVCTLLLGERAYVLGCHCS